MKESLKRVLYFGHDKSTIPPFSSMRTDLLICMIVSPTKTLDNDLFFTEKQCFVDCSVIYYLNELPVCQSFVDKQRFCKWLS